MVRLGLVWLGKVKLDQRDQSDQVNTLEAA
jgi:hypothetical protein